MGRNKNCVQNFNRETSRDGRAWEDGIEMYLVEYGVTTWPGQRRAFVDAAMNI
jgi:hypothetical protein